MTKLSRTLPTDPTARKAVLGNVQEVVDQMLLIQASKEQIAAIKETAAEKYETDVVYLAQIIYDRDYNDNKANLKAVERAEVFEELSA